MKKCKRKKKRKLFNVKLKCSLCLVAKSSIGKHVLEKNPTITDAFFFFLIQSPFFL